MKRGNEMKKQFTLLAALFAVTLMLGMGTGLKEASFQQPTTSFSLIQTVYADEAAPAASPTAEASPAPAEGEAVPKLPGMEDDPSEMLDTATFLKAAIESVGSLKGASALAIVAMVLQLLMLFFRTQLSMWAGKWRMMLVYVLSLAGGVLALKVSVPGMEWLAALLHSNTLAAAQLVLHQVKKQFWDKKDEQPA